MGHIIRSLLMITASIVLLVGFFFMASIALVIGAVIALVMGGIWMWSTRKAVSDIETLLHPESNQRPRWWTSHYSKQYRKQHQDDIDGVRPTATVSVIEGKYEVVE